MVWVIQIIFWKCREAALSKNYLGFMSAQGAASDLFAKLTDVVGIVLALRWQVCTIVNYYLR